MAADLFETYAVTIVATMVLSSIFFTADKLVMMMYPLAIGATCIITSIIGTFFVRLGKNKSIMGALYKGFIASAVLSLFALYFVTKHVIGLDDPLNIGTKVFDGFDLYLCGFIGLAITGLIIWITEYYTGVTYRPVKSVAAASETGHGTNVPASVRLRIDLTQSAIQSPGGLKNGQVANRCPERSAISRSASACASISNGTSRTNWFSSVTGSISKKTGP